MSAHASMYDRRWQKRRAQQLREHPLCAICMRVFARVTAATICDHVERHDGDPAKFAGPVQSLCKSCHDGIKQEQEKTGTFRGCDVNGRPLSPSHPWNKEAGK